MTLFYLKGILYPQIINVQSSELNTIRDLFTGKAWVKVLQSVSDINESWSCPVCSQPKWADMVGCDKCDDWYHWVCVRLTKCSWRIRNLVLSQLCFKIKIQVKVLLNVIIRHQSSILRLVGCKQV